MSDTAPHFIDTPPATPESVVEAGEAGAKAIHSTAEPIGNEAVRAAQQSATFTTEVTRQSLSRLSEINQLITDAYSQSVTDMHALCQKAFQVRSAKDWLDLNADVFSQFQRNVTIATSLYAAMWQNTTHAAAATKSPLATSGDAMNAVA